MNLIFVGDVFGSPGRQFLASRLPSLIDRYDADFVIANGENAAGGAGLTAAVADELFKMGVDVLTSGNHIWDKKEIFQVIDSERRILRPANYPPGTPGKGSGLFQAKDGKTVGVLNVAGRVYTAQNLDCPFRAMEKEIAILRQSTPIIVIDFHAEASSEKVAAGYFVDGKVSAFFGTHTHVQTADEIILPRGTAYLTDAGMTGSYEGVIGVGREIILKHFLTQLPVKHEPAKGRMQLCGAFCEITGAGASKRVERILIREN